MVFWINSRIVFYLLVGSILASSEIAFGSCIQFPKESQNPTVEVCEEPESFIFSIGNFTRSYDRKEFVESILTATSKWLLEHNNSASIVPGSNLQIWMSIPLANPEAAQPRALVFTTKGWISFWFELDASEWSFADKETALLGKDKYPENFGYRPTALIIKSQPGVPTRDVEEALFEYGATNIIDHGNGNFEANCPAFEEKRIAREASSLTSLIKYAGVNSVMEWIADRQLAFSIPLK